MKNLYHNLRDIRHRNTSISKAPAPGAEKSHIISFQGQAGNTPLPLLARELDNFLKESDNNVGFSDMLKIKEVKSFEELFEIVKSGKERDVALVILYQLLRGNRSLQDKVQEHTAVILDGFKSMEAALVWVDDIVKTGAVQERRTTVCVMGNTSAGKSSLVRTLESYCKDRGSKPKAVLTGDPENRSLIETKVMELVKDVELEKRTGLTLDVKEFKNEPKFRLICPSTEDQNEEKETSDMSEKHRTNIQMSFVDFAGHSEYVSCSTLFMKSKGIFLICFDTEKLMQATKPICKIYHPAIGTYLEIVTEKCPTPMFFLVATKMDKCKAEDANETLNEILKTAQEHLNSISKRSNRLRAAFLYNEVIQTSAADEDQLEATLENLGSTLVAVCDHNELMDVRLKTMPTVWKEMIESLRKHLQVSIPEVEQEYLKMLESNQRLVDQINQLEEEYSTSEDNLLLPLHTDDFSKWANMMREYISSGKDSTSTAEVVKDDLAVFTEKNEPLSPSPPPPLPIEKDLEEEKPKSTDEQDSVQDAEDFVVNSKVNTILQAFCAENDIFWFRYFVAPFQSQVTLFVIFN